jgi:hypothetical protein
MYTRYLLQNSQWRTKKALSVKKAHKCFAYFVILMATGGIITGIYRYRVNPKHASNVVLEWIYLSYFIVAVFVIEIIYRKLMKNGNRF